MSLEKKAFPFYKWDRNRGNSYNLSVFHYIWILEIVKTK